MGVAVVRANVRRGARVLTPGTLTLVESAETSDGVGMLGLGFAGPPGPDGTPAPTACDYECEARYAEPLAPDACANGRPGGPGG